jgi:hypothetical protein
LHCDVPIILHSAQHLFLTVSGIDPIHQLAEVEDHFNTASGNDRLSLLEKIAM